MATVDYQPSRPAPRGRAMVRDAGGHIIPNPELVEWFRSEWNAIPRGQQYNTQRRMLVYTSNAATNAVQNAKLIDGSVLKVLLGGGGGGGAGSNNVGEEVNVSLGAHERI